MEDNESQTLGMMVELAAVPGVPAAIAPDKLKMASWAEKLAKKLHGLTLEHLLAYKTDNSAPHALVLQVDSKTGEALAFLAEHEISGAPVMRGDECIGILELFDIMSAVVRQPRGSLLESLREDRSFVDDVMALPVSEVMATSERYTAAGMLEFGVDVPQSTPLTELFARLSIFWRISSHNVVATQTDLVAFIHSKGIPEDVLLLPLLETNAVTTAVHSVNVSTATGLCLASLIQHQAHVVAVVRRDDQEHPRLAGELSVFDVTSTEELRQLDLPVSQFLKQRKKRSAPLTIHYTATLGHCFEMFAAHPGHHHLWVTDVTKKLTGIVTRTGLISAFLDVQTQ